MIIISIATGMIVSLTPNLTAASVVGNTKDVHRKINQSFQMLLFMIVPMTVGLSFLAKPVYTIFYGASKFGPSVLTFYVFVALITALFTTAITITQVLKYYKVVFLSLFSGLVLKSLINVSLIKELYHLGLPAYYGSILASIIGYTLSLMICLVALHKLCGVNYEETIKQFINTLCGTVLMVIGLLLLKLIVPIASTNRFINIPIVIIYTLVGMIIYFFYMYKTNSIDKIFGEKLLQKFKKKNKKVSQ